MQSENYLAYCTMTAFHLVILTQITRWTLFERKLGKRVVKHGNFIPQMQP